MTKTGWAKSFRAAALALATGLLLSNCASPRSGAATPPAEADRPSTRDGVASAEPRQVAGTEVEATKSPEREPVRPAPQPVAMKPPASDPVKTEAKQGGKRAEAIIQAKEVPVERPNLELASPDMDEEGVEGGVAGGVVGGVVGGVIGGSLGGQAGGPMSPSAPPPPPHRYAGDNKKKDSRNEPERKIPAGADGNQFAHLKANPFTSVEKDRLSTFAVDVDTASYTVWRRYINQSTLPPSDSVRVEEFVNYFKYRYPAPEKGAFTVNLEGAPSPYTAGHHLLKVGLQGKLVAKSQRKTAHLVFLVDISGSMSDEDKLPLAREAMKLAVKNLNENDTVSIVTYAGAVHDVLAPTPATDRARIFAAIDTLVPGGGTSMGSGLELAYKHAVQKASANSTSRVVVLTDGDTNLGPNLTADSMLENVKKYVAEGVTLSTIGFGMGNYRDDLMERLADKGNGNCFYIDSYKEAKKVFEQQLAGMLEVIAKDVKVQVEFNPATVRAYRLVGYENRDIADKDFRNDKVDAGEIGAGHSVTALYEVLLTGKAGELGTVRVRAKEPSGTEAKEQAFPFGPGLMKDSVAAASDDFRFAAAVAGTADVLRRSDASESWNLATAEKLAQGATAGNPEREEFLQLLRKTRTLWEASHRISAR